MSDSGAITLRRLVVVHHTETDVHLPGVLVVRTPDTLVVLHCPDAVSLVVGLWRLRPYSARGALLRPALETGDIVRLDLAWPTGSRAVLRIPQSRWRRNLTFLAGQVADALAASGDRSLVQVLAPMLAGSPLD